MAAAAQIKTEQAQANIRRDAVAYLAGLDCRYYPEAEAALIASLRADRDQCVRLEAARALASGCCCTPATVKALTICVTGSEDDGNPSERSNAVRRAALVALQKCQSCCDGATTTTTPPEPALGQQGPTTEVTPVAFESTLPRVIADSEEERPRGLIQLWRASATAE